MESIAAAASFAASQVTVAAEAVSSTAGAVKGFKTAQAAQENTVETLLNSLPSVSTYNGQGKSSSQAAAGQQLNLLG